MNRIAISHGIIHTGEKTVYDAAVLIDHDRITALVPNQEIPSSYTVVNAEGNHISPGFIDLQIYGGGGILFAEKPDSNSLLVMAEALVRSGTTGFLLTLATNTADIFQQSIEVAKKTRHKAFMGLHFEGPFLHPDKRGAHPADCLLKPNKQNLKEILADSEGWVKMMTIAPELFDTEEIEYLISEGIVLSAGHSDCSYEVAAKGFRQGIRAATHLFNAMSVLHHRQTGLPGAVFLSDDIYASIIADGIHVSYETVALSKKILKERLFLITDAIQESYSGTYQHRLNGDHYVLTDGTLSGSALTMMNAVRNCVEHAGIALDEALRMATLYPARLIKAEDMGRIAPGQLANINIFDQHYQIRQVFLHGTEQLNPKI